MTSFLIVFVDSITNTEILEMIYEYWPGVSLKERPLSLQKKLRNRKYGLFRNGNHIADATVNDKRDSHGLPWFPRSYEHAPFLFFSIEPDAGYIPRREDEKYLIEWPRRLILSNYKNKIRYLFLELFIEYFSSMEEFSNTLLSLKVYSTESSDGQISTNWDENIPMDKQYYEKQNEFKKISEQFLKSKSANGLFYIEYKNGGIIFIPRPTAVELGLTQKQGFGLYDSLIGAFMLYEKEER